MSQAAVEKTLGNLITDECFPSRFFKDPAAASFAVGLALMRLEVKGRQHNTTRRSP